MSFDVRVRVQNWATFGGPGTSRTARVVRLALYGFGTAACLPFLYSTSGRITFALVVAATILGRRLTALIGSKSFGLRSLGWLCAIGVVCFNAAAVFLAIAFGVLLAWTVPVWGWIALLVLAVGVAGLRVPIVLPLGLWISLCLWGWLREESFLRCDDYLRLSPSVHILVPTRSDEAACRPGDALPIHRFPRHTWESPDQQRIVFTSQKGLRGGGQRIAEDTIDGLVCETPTSGTAAPRCVGGWDGKSQGITDAPARDRLFVSVWSLPGEHRSGAEVLGVSRTTPLQLLETHALPQTSVCETIYQPRTDALWLFGDDLRSNQRFRAADFAPLPDVPVKALINEVRYDQSREEGIICGEATVEGEGGAALIAIAGDPPHGRRLTAPDRSRATALWGSWGCDWDAATRQVYVAVPNLGLVAQVDYDTGKVKETHFVGFGMRSVALDAARRRLYLTNFLHGDVVAVDLDTGREIRRWFVGRYAREVRLTRDRASLLVGTNVGLLRIPLGSP